MSNCACGAFFIYFMHVHNSVDDDDNHKDNQCYDDYLPLGVVPSCFTSEDRRWVACVHG